ncbi:hypothetical protein ACSNOK_16955 [Streptomyces sp. URMC 126]|uniref:hypothetical protein n=1 Tax=Streptomyces sp. URMC 126 TaxID=3423401 RepID=UPI003F1B8EEB
MLDGDALYAVEGDRVSRRRGGQKDWGRPLGHATFTTPVTVEGSTVWVVTSSLDDKVTTLRKVNGEPVCTYSGEVGEWLTAGAGSRVFPL